MKRRTKAFLTILIILFCIALYCYFRATVYDRIVKASPEKINCTNRTVESVTLMTEYVSVISKDGTGTRGVASFENNGKIYLFGHSIKEPVGSLAFKVEEFSNEITANDLMGEVILNEKNGVIVEQYQAFREYTMIPIAKTAYLGKAYAVGRDNEGNICKYPITIEAFKEGSGVFFYNINMPLSNGVSGTPIIQNDELIGVHYGTTKNGKGIGWIIWHLDIVLS